MGKIKRLSVIVFILMELMFYGTANAQGNNIDYSKLLRIPKQYTALRTSEKMIIDGKDDEKAWSKAPWTPFFSDIVTGITIDSEQETKCKMLWDNDFLYLFVKLQEHDLWASIRKHDDQVFQDNAFEMFIAPDGETRNYFEFQINGYGTVWDLFMPKPYRNGGRGLSGWNMNGLQKAVYLDGTLNNPADIDRSWSIELAVPFSSVHMNGSQYPVTGTIWRMNFSRVQWDLDTLNGKYCRKKNKITGKLFPEHYSVWSPQGIVNLHYPERWGYVLFSDTLSANSFLSPEVEKLKLLLWKYYYLQQDFKAQSGIYATALEQLDKIYTGDPGLTADESNIKMNANEHQFWLQVFLPSLNENMSVDEEGEMYIENSGNLEK
jgi:hypothetical protein